MRDLGGSKKGRKGSILRKLHTFWSQEENIPVVIATNLFLVVSSEDLTCLWLWALCRGLFSFALYKPFLSACTVLDRFFPSVMLLILLILCQESIRSIIKLQGSILSCFKVFFWHWKGAIKWPWVWIMPTSGITEKLVKADIFQQWPLRQALNEIGFCENRKWNILSSISIL